MNFFINVLRDKLIKDKDSEIKQLEDDIAYYKRCLALHTDGAQIIELGDSFLKKPPL